MVFLNQVRTRGENRMLLLIFGGIIVFCIIVLSFIGKVEGGWAENRKKRIEEIINEKGINVDKRHDSKL